MKIDIVMGLIVPAFIAFIFGALSTWLTYGFQRKQDEISWKHEKEKIQDEFKQDLHKQRELSVRTEILPAIWNNLLNTQGRIGVITAFYKEHPDLNHWSDEQIKEFLQKSTLSDYHKNQLYQSSDKSSSYKNIIVWYQLSDAEQAYSQFHNHILSNEILVGDEVLHKKLAEIDKCFFGILNEIKFNHQLPVGSHYETYKSYADFNQQVEALKISINQIIQQRLNS